MTSDRAKKLADSFDETVDALGIVATADVCLGEPRIDGTRVTVDLLAKRFRHGEGMQAIARDYDLDVVQVENAIRYACLPLQHRRAWLRRRVPEGEQLEAEREQVEIEVKV